MSKLIINEKSRELKFKAVMQRLDGVVYVSEEYSSENGLSYLFDKETDRWDTFLEKIVTEKKFLDLFPDEDEYLKGWRHIETIQCSSIKDKNNIEICEGDILICGDINIKYVVEWIDCGLKARQITNKSTIGLTHWQNKIEVISNRFENPELLEKNNKKSA